MEVPRKPVAQALFALDAIHMGGSRFLPEDTGQIHNARVGVWKLDPEYQPLHVAAIGNDRTWLPAGSRAKLQFSQSGVRNLTPGPSAGSR